MKTIDYYYFSSSPFSYLGHKALEEVAAKHGCKIVYKPVNLFGIWEISGAVPPPKRPPVRQRLRLVEMQRCADFRGLPLNVKPAFWPVDGAFADCCAIALQEEGHNPSEFIFKVLSGVWANEENIADEEVLAGYLKSCGFDAASILAKAKSEAIAEIRKANTQEAIDNDAVGVPTYVFNGEAFWGQDRIDHLDHALTSGRGAIKAG